MLQWGVFGESTVKSSNVQKNWLWLYLTFSRGLVNALLLLMHWFWNSGSWWIILHKKKDQNRLGKAMPGPDIKDFISFEGKELLMVTAPKVFCVGCKWALRKRNVAAHKFHVMKHHKEKGFWAKKLLWPSYLIHNSIKSKIWCWN